MKIKIITYNKKIIKIGEVLSIIGFLIILSNLFKIISLNIGMIVALLGLFIMMVGFFFVGYFSKRIEIIGFLFFKDLTTEFNLNDVITEIENKDYFVKTSNSGFKGQHNYIPFLTVGSFTTNSGINKISFFNNTSNHTFEILIDSENEFKKFGTLVNSKFRKPQKD